LVKPSVRIADPSDTVSFSSLVERLEDGALDRDLTEALRRTVSHMGRSHRASGGRPSGKITLAIEFQWVDGMVQTRQSFKCEPAQERAADRFYPTPDGLLTQASPFVQESLGIPLVKADKGEKRR
jgi:hypothetical protein